MPHLSEDELISMYKEIYRNNVNYGGSSDRNAILRDLFYKHVKPHIPYADGIDILDASCGGGDLMRLLDADDNILVHGSEVSQELIESDRLKGLHVAKGTYDDLPEVFNSQVFDVVFSNDVLEHLHSEAQARRALRNFYVLSSWCCVSISLRPAKSKLEGVTRQPDNIHTLVRPAQWWMDTFEDSGWEIRAVHQPKDTTLFLVCKAK